MTVLFEEREMELETKDGAANREIKDAFGDFLRAFEAFKESNDARLIEIEKRGGDVVLEEKVDRINTALSEQKSLIDELTLSAARPALGETKAQPDRLTRERKASFDRYMRKGDGGAFEMKAMSAGSNGDGGYVVPLEIAQTIDRVLAKASPIRALATVQQIGGNTYRKPVTTVEAASGWVGETDSRTQTNTPTIAALDFPAMELYAMPAATQTLLDDAQVDIEQWLANEVQIVFAEQEGAAFINGDGSAKPTGFLHYTAVADSAASKLFGPRPRRCASKPFRIHFWSAAGRPLTSKGEIMLSGYKTYIAGALTILGALGGFLTGSLAPDQALNLVVPAILAMTVRHGVSTAAAS